MRSLPDHGSPVPRIGEWTDRACFTHTAPAFALDESLAVRIIPPGKRFPKKDSLKGLPDTLGQLGKQLAGPANTLPALARSLDTLGSSISQLQTTLTDFQGVVGSYQDLINRYRSMIQSLQKVMVRLVTVLPAVVTFFLFWLAMLQLLVLVKAWEWLRGPKSQPEPVKVSMAPPALNSPTPPEA